MTKKDLTFELNAASGLWEAVASGVSGMWQLHMEFGSVAASNCVKVFSKAADAEAWSKVWENTIDDEVLSWTEPFQSIVSESVKVVSECEPELGNIRME